MSVVTKIPRAETPEAAGVNSKEVNRFLREAKESGYEFHSMMIVKDGKVACEWYNEPFGPDFRHILYSGSKSFASTAIGFAVDEGILTTETRLIDIFNNFKPKRNDKKISTLRVKHLLTMTAGKYVSMLYDKAKKDWVENFFSSSWRFAPGEEFAYVNENCYIMAAIIQKLTGMSVTEYLKPRLFDKLGFTEPYWERDPRGVEVGGWGLYITTEDFAKFMLCYLNGGKYEGEQVIPEAWAREAVSCQVANSQLFGDPDCAVGYGYNFWINPTDEPTYRADGLFSQYGICFPERNAVAVFMGGIPDENAARKCVWRHFPKVFEPSDDAPEPIRNYVMDMPVLSFRSPKEKEISGRPIHFKRKKILNIAGFPLSVLPLGVTFMQYDRAGNIDDVIFSFDKNTCVMSWREGEELNTLTLGMDGQARIGEIKLGHVSYKTSSYAEWTDEKTLVLQIRLIETISKRILTFSFDSPKKVSFVPRSTPKLKDLTQSLKPALADMTNSKLVLKVLEKAFVKLPAIVEPKHKGRFIGE